MSLQSPSERLPFFARIVLGETIAGRLLRWFVIISVAPVLVVLFVTWWIAQERVESMHMGSLAAIAELKADRLHGYARRRIQVVTALGISPGINETVRRLGDPASTPDVRDEQIAYLHTLASVYDAPDVLVISLDGTILHSTGEPWLIRQSLETGPLRESALARAVDRARMLMQAEVSEPEAPRPGQLPMVYVVGPIIKGLTLVGFLAFELSSSTIDEVLLDATGLGETGQTTCAAILGADLVVTAPTRFDPDAAFNVRVPVGSRRLEQLQEAVRGADVVGRGEDELGRAVIGAWKHVAPFHWGLGVTMQEAEVFALAKRQQLAAFAVAIAAIIPAAFVAYTVARSLSRPIERAASASERLAGGDLATPIEPIGRGEPRRLLESMKSSVGTLGALLGRLRRSAAELEQTAGEIRRTSAEQEDVAQGFGASATEVAAAVTEMTGTGRELAGTMGLVAEAAENAAAAAGRGREGLAELDGRTRLLRDATEGVARRLETIRERAVAINTVVTTITRVADQTNLLSINAALEAEKAGRYGLGFQVVAREINRLSEQTGEATTDIERIVAEMQDAVAEGVGEMDRFSHVMEESAATTEEIGGRLSEIIGLVEDLKERFGRVAEGMDAQSIGTKQISEAMNQLSDGARRTIAAVRSFVAAGEQLERSAKALDQDVSRFKLPEA